MPARQRLPAPRTLFRLRSERTLRTTASSAASGTPIGTSGVGRVGCRCRTNTVSRVRRRLDPAEHAGLARPIAGASAELGGSGQVRIRGQGRRAAEGRVAHRREFNSGRAITDVGGVRVGLPRLARRTPREGSSLGGIVSALCWRGGWHPCWWRVFARANGVRVLWRPIVASWLMFRSLLRTRWAVWLGLAVLVGATAGVVMAGFAGARRTASAHDRFVAEQRGFDVTIAVDCGSQYEPPARFGLGCLDDIAAVPSVADVTVVETPRRSRRPAPSAPPTPSTG